MYNLQFGNRNYVNDEARCEKELAMIGESLQNSDLWAIKLLDAWGKFLSGILSGNAFDFGAFSQCFHLERNGQHYAAQYCIGRFTFDSNNFSSKNEKDLQEDDIIMSRAIVSRPKTGKAINIGICLPDVCSPNLMRKKVERIIGLMLKNITFEIQESTCQFEENFTHVTAADWVTIGLLLCVLCLMVISTCYDIWCTPLEKKSKSRALLAFSAYTNGVKLLSYDQTQSQDVMQCLHGIRVISTLWVTLWHTFSMYLVLPSQNGVYFDELASRYINVIITSARISVDSFLVLGGLLASNTILKGLEKTGGRINIPMLYVHRYLRLTPLLVVIILILATLMRFLGNGPIWPTITGLIRNQCERGCQNWWSTLLYIQNYANVNDMCFSHSWYLSVDFQLFFIAPFIVLIIYKFKSKAVFGLSIFILGCIGCTISTFLMNDFKDYFMGGEKMAKTYYPTHLRFSPWLIGICGGYILHESRKKTIRIPKLVNLLGWIISFSLMTTAIFANSPSIQLNNNKTSALNQALCESLSRVAWAIALLYIIFACVHNCGGVINWFLSNPLWQPISRLSFPIYLIHFPVVVYFHATMKSTPHISEATTYHIFFGDFVTTFILSIFAALAFELPVVELEKLIFKKQRTAPKERETN